MKVTLKELKTLINNIILQEINYRISSKEEAEEAGRRYEKTNRGWLPFKGWLENSLNDISPAARNLFLRGFRNGTIPHMKPDNIDQTIKAFNKLLTGRTRTWITNYNNLSPEQKAAYDQTKINNITASYTSDTANLINEIINKLNEIKDRWETLKNTGGSLSDEEKLELEALNRGLRPQDILPDVKSYNKYPLDPPDIALAKLSKRRPMPVPF